MIIIISNFKCDIQSEDVIFLENVCDIKFINSKHNIIFLLDKYLDDEGAIDNKYMFEEILITLEVDAIISNSVNNKLKEVCAFYDISRVCHLHNEKGP